MTHQNPILSLTPNTLFYLRAGQTLILPPKTTIRINCPLEPHTDYNLRFKGYFILSSKLNSPTLKIYQESFTKISEINLIITNIGTTTEKIPKLTYLGTIIPIPTKALNTKFLPRVV